MLGLHCTRRPSTSTHTIAATIAIIATTVTVGLAATAAPARAGVPGRHMAQDPSRTGSAYRLAETTRRYAIRFWPRYLSYAQQSAGRANTLIGPATIDAQYRSVVAVNDDTLYASSFVDLAQGPVVLTIPPSPVTYSLLTLDVFGSSFNTGISSGAAGTFALVPPGWSGELPQGLTQVMVPYPTTVWIIRTDKYSHTGQDMTVQATEFRASLHLTSLADYRNDQTSGAAHILPVTNFAVSFKLLEDRASQSTPTEFLDTMRKAVHDPSTAPLSTSDLQLSQAFDQIFQAAQQAASDGNPRPLSVIDAATRSVYPQIVSHWQTHTGATNWVHFDNIAAWGNAHLDRAAANEYLQYGNTEKTAAYWQAFQDGAGQELDGAEHDYQLTFPADLVPQAERFWSLTAYTPDAVELVPNTANKYVVASYTSGLRNNPDGSITICLRPDAPTGASDANWLPVPHGPFSVMLRVYGPRGNTGTDRTYLPPSITPVGAGDG